MVATLVPAVGVLLGLTLRRRPAARAATEITTVAADMPAMEMAG